MTDLAPEQVLIEAKIAGHKTATGYVFNSNEEAARIAVAALRAHHLLRGEGERELNEATTDALSWRGIAGQLRERLRVLNEDSPAIASYDRLVDAILDPPTPEETT